MSATKEMKPATMEGDGFCRASDAASWLGCSRAYVYAAMEDGRLPYVRLGRARRIPKAALREFVARNLVGTC